LEQSQNTGFANFSILRKNIISKSTGTLVVAAAHDKHTLEAVYAYEKEIPLNYILVGDRHKIMALAAEIGWTPNEETIVNCTDDEKCASVAVKLIRDGTAQVLMKGILDTGTLLKAVLDKDEGIRDNEIMSHIAMLEVPGYHKLVIITDGGMITNPNLEQKQAIVLNAVNFLRKLGIATPKVAALCAGEAVSPKLAETVEARALQNMAKEGAFGSCILEGPISFDLAVDPSSARTKGFESEITGEVDILLVPEITAGNALAKGLIQWGGATMAGCVVGAKAPIVLASRAASAKEKLLSMMICMAGA